MREILCKRRLYSAQCSAQQFLYITQAGIPSDPADLWFGRSVMDFRIFFTLVDVWISAEDGTWVTRSTVL